MSSKVDSRAKAIMRVVLQAEEISVEGLVQHIGTSATNIRRDLAQLEKRGLVSRTRGRAAVPASLLYKAFQHDQSMLEPHLRFAEQKRRIGFAASELIMEGETVGLTAGATTTQIGRALRHRQNISVVTNALNIAMELSHQSAIKTTLTAGELAEGQNFALVTESALSFLNEVYLDKVFIGVTGFDLGCGATALDVEEAKISRAMIRQSAHVVVVADSSKVGRRGAECMCACSEVDVLVTDFGISEELCETFRAKGIKVVCV